MALAISVSVSMVCSARPLILEALVPMVEIAQPLVIKNCRTLSFSNSPPRSHFTRLRLIRPFEVLVLVARWTSLSSSSDRRGAKSSSVHLEKTSTTTSTYIWLCIMDGVVAYRTSMTQYSLSVAGSL